MANRNVEDIRFGLTPDGSQIQSLRFKMSGGDSGSHFVTFLTGEWFCDCFGFTSHKICRHVKAGIIIEGKLNEALQEISRREMINDWTM